MRGQAKQPRLACSLTRITPADAGTSGGLECVRWCHADHPRGCGDKLFDAFVYAALNGSPPRMRGQATCYLLFGMYLRITPADAGTRGRLLHARCPQTDHPRGCGDKSAGMVRSIGGYGSPPRMRGQVQNLRNKLSGCRITPADAGTSCATEGNEKREKDHPRGCGDKRQRHCYVLSPVGSPPRMRGQGGGRMDKSNKTGITPADAGTSSSGI